MKEYITTFLILFNLSLINSQYTETINSNRPGSSAGAFSVGKNVLQFELGYENSLYEHTQFNNSKKNDSIFFFAVKKV